MLKGRLIWAIIIALIFTGLAITFMVFAKEIVDFDVSNASIIDYIGYYGVPICFIVCADLGVWLFIKADRRKSHEHPSETEVGK